MTHLLRTAAACPECGTPPRIRIPEAERALAWQQPPDAEKQTYHCHNRRCGAIYTITARDYQRAA